MSNYFYKTFVKNSYVHKISDAMVEKMMVRKPLDRPHRLHINAKKRYNKLTQAPLPLKYKLQELPEPDTSLDTPLGVSPDVPFKVERTNFGNLPVYTDYKNSGMRKITIIRRLYGDIDEFKTELAKICGNQEIYEKIGKVEVKGIHVEKVNLWLRRLGF